MKHSDAAVNGVERQNPFHEFQAAHAQKSSRKHETLTISDNSALSGDGYDVRHQKWSRAYVLEIAACRYKLY